MARDEALLNCVGRGESPPTLRFYRWNPATISLGYFQHYRDYEQLPPPAGALAVVRRLTGGGAILHDRELTYSITVPIDHPLLGGGPNQLYEIAHDAIIAAAGEMGVTAARGCQSDGSGAAKGPFFCFARRHCLDVLIGDDKFAGSAQRRTRAAVLQHGSIILDRQFDQQPTAIIESDNDNAAIDRWIEAVTKQFAVKSNIAVQNDDWSEAELSVARSLVAKYAGDEWTRRT